MNGLYRAVIFDMDGVLADSEPVYERAFTSVLAVAGKKFTPELQQQTMGHSIESSWGMLAHTLDLGADYQPLVDAYDSFLLDALAQVHETLPGVRELIDGLRALKVPVGLASSSLPGWIDALLSGTGLTSSFDAIVPRVEVANGKPAPDIYLEAAQRLNVAPELCIAIEDTPTGVASARAAGMLAVQVRSASSAWPPLDNANLVLDSLLDFDLTLLAR